jgi:hypothetical protein
LRGVGGHHVGRRRPAQDQLHERALHAHGRQAEQTGDEGQRRVGGAEWRPDHAGDEKPGQQRAFEGQAPGERRASAVIGNFHKQRGRCTGNQKDGDGKRGQQVAFLAPRDLRPGGDEAAGHLSDEEAEQGQKGAAVDISCNQAEQQRSRSCAWSRLFLMLGHAWYLRIGRDPRYTDRRQELKVWTPPGWPVSSKCFKRPVLQPGRGQRRRAGGPYTFRRYR